jgi:hypothetical protein
MGILNNVMLFQSSDTFRKEFVSSETSIFITYS